jgi:hypothetical protein
MTIKLPIDNAGYWISPNNYLVPVQTHIQAVCDNPTTFGTTEAEMRVGPSSRDLFAWAGSAPAIMPGGGDGL